MSNSIQDVTLRVRICALVLFAVGAAGCQSQYLVPGSSPVSPTSQPTPAIVSLSTTSGAIGSSVTIAGINFGGAQGASTVAFNGTGATAKSWATNSIVVTVPSGATSGSVVVTAGLPSNGVSFTVTP